MRVISIPDLATALEEIRKIGADELGQKIMASKAVFRAVKVRDLTPVQANVLKQEMLARGGEAVVARGTITYTVERTDVLLLGTLKQFRQLIAKLKQQPFGLPRLAEKLAQVLENAEGFRPFRLNCRGRELRLGERTLIMGILNVTPDSFSDGGKYNTVEAARARTLEMVEEGADIIDLGGESTRPGHTPVEAEEELRRVIPVLEAILPEVPVPISIDTSKAVVAEEALRRGAHLINDQRALADPNMAAVVARYEAPVVLMHNPSTPQYRDLMGDIVDHLAERVEYAVASGIPREHIILDPGIGFGKTPEQNLEVVRRLDELKSLGLPILVGPSRKSFIGYVLNLPVEERLEGTAAAVAVSIVKGADIVRVHDVKQMVRVARMTDALVRGRNLER